VRGHTLSLPLYATGTFGSNKKTNTMNKTSTFTQKFAAGCIAILISASCIAQTDNNTAPATKPGATKTPAGTPTVVKTSTGSTTTPATTGKTTTTPAVKPNTTPAPGTPSSTTPAETNKDLKLVKQTLVYNSGKVYLNWVVPSNSPDCIYVIERSIDGTEYEPLGLKEGIQSPLELLYSWVDTKPMEGVAHYRIKRVNNDGEVTALSSSSEITTPAPSPLIRDNSQRAAFAK
jgi:hypothetical protein